MNKRATVVTSGGMFVMKADRLEVKGDWMMAFRLCADPLAKEGKEELVGMFRAADIDAAYLSEQNAGKGTGAAE